MVIEPQTTHFAPAERATPQELQAEQQKLFAHPLISALLDCFPEPVVVLNRQRQIVLSNGKFAALLNRSQESLIGLRPGEALGCIHPEKEPGGCGTTRFCRFCGAVNAILNSQRSGEPDEEECRIQCILNGQPGVLDLRVRATPVVVNDESFTVFAIHDAADEKRRQVLERLFFHDILNTAGGLSGLLDILPELDKEEATEVGQEAHFLAEQLIEEIQSQRDLAAAERGDLKMTSGVIDAVDLLRRLTMLYRHHSVAEGKTIAVQEDAEPVVLQSDARLLARVLGNLIKNALEASKKGETVTVWVENVAAPAFHVRNQAAMPEEVQAQMFQRSFSTKGGVGHGVGTYSVKLLTQNYLRGTVEFHSSTAGGTTFTVRLPLRLDVVPDGAQ